MRLSRSAFVVLAVTAAIAACAGVKPVMFGDYAALRPTFTLREKENPLQHFTLSLAEPAYVAMFWVVPGQGARLIFPRDSMTANHFDAGSRELVASFPRPINRDSLIAAARNRTRRPTDRTARDSTRSPIMRADSIGLPSGPLNTDIGQVVLFTSAAPLQYAALRGRVEGISIPIEDNSAVNTIVKLIRTTIPESATWAAYAREVELP